MLPDFCKQAGEKKKKTHKAAQPGENVSIHWRPGPSAGKKIKTLKKNTKKNTTRRRTLNTAWTELNKQQAAFAWGDKRTEMLSDEWADVERQEQTLQPRCVSAGLTFSRGKKKSIGLRQEYILN